MTIRSSKRIIACALFVSLSVPASIYYLFVDGVKYMNVGQSALCLVVSIYIASVIFAERRVDHQKVKMTLGIRLASLYDRTNTRIIEWQDVTRVDAFFTLLPPYIVSIQGIDRETGQETEVSFDRFSPDIEYVYKLIYRNVEEEYMSKEFKDNTEHVKKQQTHLEQVSN